jgi:uncharacterized protein
VCFGVGGTSSLKAVCAAILALLIASAAACPAAADNRASVLNDNAVGLIASNPRLVIDAASIARATDHVSNLRVLPILGRGSLQSLNDLLFLESADAAVMSSDSLAFARKQKLYAGEAEKISYLAKLGNSSIILLARSGVTNINDLAGRKVAAGSADSDAFVAADLIFGDSGVDIERVSINGAEAIAALRDGRIDAALMTTAESGDALASIAADSGLTMVPLAITDRLGSAYAPAIATREQFPTLVKSDQPVETVAAALVLAVYDWPKTSRHFTKLKKFNSALFDSYFASLPEERRTNVTASVPGWKPYEALKESSRQSPVAAAGVFVAYSP